MSDPIGRPRHVVRLSEAREAVPFELAPEAEARAAVAAELGLPGVRKLRFAGRLLPEGRQDWRLDADLGATVVQDCVVTLEPVVTRIDERIARRYVQGFREPEGGEAEVPEEDVEALPASLDLGEVMVEALALALPPYPRAEGVTLGEVVAAEPGVEPLTEETRKPFAELRDVLGKDPQ